MPFFPMFSVAEAPLPYSPRPPKLLDWLRQALRARHYRRRTDWQGAFPQENRWVNPQTKEQGRHHMDESLIQKAVREAVAKAGLAKQATCHLFRHSFATPLREGGYDIRNPTEQIGDGMPEAGIQMGR